jgi:hypothetical protein
MTDDARSPALNERSTAPAEREHDWDGVPMVPAYMCLNCKAVHWGNNPPRYTCPGKEMVTYV